ncbi:MAG: TonB-dependent receptor [Candidatus Eremiobacteraeota bacterium]|nr:TonB-dependent receptor [Candidatus Eremiobacteraeota bacterium]MBV9699248.1 TonB-dependent receptor [Candidatus Eremiobacteraeota bacterium]
MGTFRALTCAPFAFIILLAAAPAVAPAQDAQPLKISGTVSATDGTPIAGATITISSQGFVRSTRSDRHGHFHLKHVPAGTYSVRASAAAYQTLWQRTVTLDASNHTIALVLAAVTTNSLTVIGQVRASAGETVSTSSAPTISLSATQAAAAAVTSVASMLYDQPSTTPVLPMGGGSNAATVFAVRGPDPTETLVDIDGHQVNNGGTGTVDLSLIDPAALEDVQVIYGISPSSLIGPNTIGGGVNIVTLVPTATPQSLMRIFGGSYGTFGTTLQTTGTDSRIGYAFSLHATTSDGSVNQTLPDGERVGSGSDGESLLTKLRYQLGGPNGYGYVQLNFRNQTVTRDDSALLTTFTPPGFSGQGGTYQSFAGTVLGVHQANYGVDAQLPLGGAELDGAPANVLQLSHLTTLAAQSVSGPGADSLSYLYNQRDLLSDDWLELDHRMHSGVLSFKYDVGTESLRTDYVQGQVTAEAIPIGPIPAPNLLTNAIRPMDAMPAVNSLTLSQTQRFAVLRYAGDPSTALHYSLALYQSDYSTFGSSFDPRAGFTWTPTGSTAVRASVGTTFQSPQLSELVVPPPNDRVPVGGIVFIGNPNLKADRATDYDLGMEQILAVARRPVHVGMDLYQTNLRSPSALLNVTPIPNCQTKKNPTPCPLSYPVNAGNGIYRGVEVHADADLGPATHVRAGWDVNSSFLTVIPPSIQDGTLVPGQQILGEPLHKAYLSFEHSPPSGFGFGARLSYDGAYNELNRPPYATLDAHVTYRRAGYEYGLYGTNLTNVYSGPFTIVGGGVPYGTLPGQPMILPNAYVLQGAAVNFVVTRKI